MADDKLTAPPTRVFGLGRDVPDGAQCHFLHKDRAYADWLLEGRHGLNAIQLYPHPSMRHSHPDHWAVWQGT